ncbi:MAG: hypothetical protein J6N49_02450 [Alphaproteobacteria bacterium]|nr:hypothetical protein [Alphaproteobacteria bacterium]
MSTMSFSGAQFIALQAGMNMQEDASLVHENHWLGLTLALIASGIYTLGGLLFRFEGEPFLTFIVTVMLLMVNVIQWASCLQNMMAYKLKTKVQASVCAIAVALITFLPAVFFVLQDITDRNNTLMVIFAIVLVVIGVFSVVLPVSHLLIIRHKCRVWGRRLA